MLPPRLTILLIFSLHGFGIGSLFSRIADIQTQLSLTEAALGTALVGVPIGVILGAQLVTNLIERYGTRSLLLYSFAGSALAPALTASATGTATLFAAFSCFGFTLASSNITMNIEADRVEAASKARILNRSHGMWGVGFLVASLAATGMVYLGIAPLWHFLATAFATLICTGTLIAGLKSSPPRGASRKGNRFALPSKPVLLILGFLASGVILEGVTRNWSVIYLRDAAGARDDIATLALSAFIATQTLGRFLADTWIDKAGPVKVARSLTVVTLAGLILVVAGTIPIIALIGFALIGFGVSTSYPQAISAVAQLPGDRPSSENVAALTTVTTLMNFVVPPVFGFVATGYSLQTSFMLVLPLPVLAFFMARYLRPKT